MKKLLHLKDKKSKLLIFKIVLLLFIGSCTKENFKESDQQPKKTLAENSPDLKNRLAEIKRSFYSRKLDLKLKTNIDTSLIWTPEWDNPHIQTINDSVSYVFYPLIGHLWRDGKLYKAQESGAKSYIIVKNEKYYFRGRYYQPNNQNTIKSVGKLNEINTKNFTGKLFLSNLEVKENYVIDYKNGAISEAYRKNGEVTLKKLQSNRGATSYFENYCHTEIKSCTYVTYFMSCTGGFVIEYSYDCQQPTYCQASVWILTDYSIENICESVWFPDPPEPIDPGNGSGGESTPDIETKQDSLQKYYPCMVKEVLDKLLANSTYGKLIQPFQSIQLPNGTTINIPGLPNLTFGFSSQPYGGTGNNYMLGNTGRTAPTFSGTSSQIEFNSSAINNASKLFLQMATIHEVAHAYANYYIKMGSYGVPVDTTRYSTWAMDVINFESIAKSEINGANFNDHSLFIENYVDNFVKILKDVNGTSYTDKQYQMAAIYGLNNPGDRTYNYLGIGVDLYSIYKDKLEKSYNNLLTKFGITAAERDAFYLANLMNVPTNKKLPTNCPN
ncbi:MAG: hypothetical protein WC622_02200 [Pedobacter sp.]|jgi:hypothetical protein|uniref:hypothetical protein n=1 Tax=Pedobacter sp. TaxID=1411316 RepID=UPI003569F382